MAKEQESKSVVTRAEKKDGAKKIILELLAKSASKSTALIDEAAKVYTAKFGGEENENPNDVKGRIGSVLSVMKKEGEVLFDGGMYSLKQEKAEEKPKKTTRAKAKKKEEKTETVAEAEGQEKPKKTTRTRKTKAKEEEPKKEEEQVQPLPPAPVQPIAPVAPITPEVAPEPIPEDKPKKRTTKKAKAVKTEEVKAEEKPTEEPAPAPVEVKAEEKKEESPKGTLMDMSFLFGDIKPAKKEEVKKEVVKEVKAEEKPAPKAEPKKEPKQAQKPKQAQSEKRNERNASVSARKPRAMTADEKLQEAFLKRLHRLGGDYFEYYSVYLLERYSRMNGRRLEALKITGGDHDGGIDGEIELTDRLGFRETIYIQAKNWDPDKGDEKLWVVGETLLQQFIGACVCRQAKDGKQHCRGIFITTSRFTPEARRILDETADKFVGYDASDLYEAAKECQFGIIKKNGEWSLDEELLSGEKAFFKMF